MESPAISVVVPSYRRPDRLPRLVEAFERQTLPFERFELLVIDNGSGDETSDVLAELARTSPVGLRPLRIEDNRGPAPARNLGWQQARAPFVAFTDDDCVPSPGWLEWGLRALEADPTIGVVQGRTLPPVPPYKISRWPSYREIVEPSPWFEGCNLFFRRDALERTGGFDESILFGGEDTASGWSVLDEGWDRLFEEQALVFHDVDERGVKWHMKMGWREGNLLQVARRYPRLRTEGFWRPWAAHPWHVLFAMGAAGTLGAAATRRFTPLLFWLPWLSARRPPWRFRPWFRYLGERWIVDASAFAGMSVAAVRYRQLVL